MTPNVVQIAFILAALTTSIIGHKILITAPMMSRSNAIFSARIAQLYTAPVFRNHISPKPTPHVHQHWMIPQLHLTFGICVKLAQNGDNEVTLYCALMAPDVDMYCRVEWAAHEILSMFEKPSHFLSFGDNSKLKSTLLVKFSILNKLLESATRSPGTTM